MLRFSVAVLALAAFASIAQAETRPVKHPHTRGHAHASASSDPEQSWNEAVDQRARDFKQQQDIENNAIKVQAKADRTQRALQLTVEATGEPAEAFTMKCVRGLHAERFGHGNLIRTHCASIARQSMPLQRLQRWQRICH